MRASFAIEIPRRGQVCRHGQEQLSPGMEYYSVINQEDSDQFDRQDFCTSCWEKLGRDNARPSGVQWKSRLPMKKESSRIPQNRNDRALELLKDALQVNEEESRVEAYVLALFLARNRQIALRQEIRQENGTHLLVYEILATEEMLGVQRIDISALHIEKIQNELSKKLAG